MPKLRSGHAPSHVRDTADNAFEAWLRWDRISPEPTVEYEIGYIPHDVSISRACGLVWNCNDMVPGSLFDQIHGELEYSDIPLKRRTYAAVARAILEDIKGRSAPAPAAT